MNRSPDAVGQHCRGFCGLEQAWEAWVTNYTPPEYEPFGFEPAREAPPERTVWTGSSQLRVLRQLETVVERLDALA